jgi:GT2 family glycosyltransferase
VRKPADARVAVVIPGHNAAGTLPACLDSLLPLLDNGQIEGIVFVDDHSTDSTREIVARYPVEIASSPRRGAGAARNVGWRVARADLVWFVDADCVVQRDALARLRSTMQELDAAVVGGSYANESVGSLTAELIHEEMVTRHRAMGREVTFAITANLLCRRSALEEVDGFDESLRLGQDLDFAYRIVHSGRRLGFDAASLVGHFHEKRLLRYLVKQARQGYWRMHLYRRHPRRMTGDSYSGLLDYIQPPLAVVAVISSAVGPAIGAPILGCGVVLTCLAALLLCQLPMSRKLVRASGDHRYWCYLPFGMTRAAFRGAGMLVGFVAAATTEAQRASVRTRPHPGGGSAPIQRIEAPPQ